MHSSIEQQKNNSLKLQLMSN